jgi:phytoene desaturase
MPISDVFSGHMSKKLSGLDRFYMAGQWVEPGGGIPIAVMSGRQAVQLMCEEAGIHFVASGKEFAGKSVA